MVVLYFIVKQIVFLFDLQTKRLCLDDVSFRRLRMAIFALAICGTIPYSSTGKTAARSCGGIPKAH
jgi:hypothetical protein